MSPVALRFCINVAQRFSAADAGLKACATEPL
jgi:hypothetical protein